MSEQKALDANEFNLNEKQFRFALEYIVDLNETQAAIRAGYSPKTARQQASRLMSNVNVQLACARAREEWDKQYQYRIMGRYEVLAELTEIARKSDIGELLQVDDKGEIVDDLDSVSVKQAKKQGKSKFIKKAKITTTQGMSIGAKGEPMETMTTTVEVEMYSRHEALRDLGKHHGLFNEEKVLPQSANVQLVIIERPTPKQLEQGGVTLDIQKRESK